MQTALVSRGIDLFPRSIHRERSKNRLYANFTLQARNFTLPGDAIGERFHADFKVTKDWGNSGKSSIFVSYNDWDVVRSLAISQAQFKTAACLAQQSRYTAIAIATILPG